MDNNEKHLALHFENNDGVILISATIPEEQLKGINKLIWGLGGGGMIWILSHLPMPLVPQFNPSTQLPPDTTHVQPDRPSIQE
jgi:hypothetical protein